jgi:hypothetical protein
MSRRRLSTEALSPPESDRLETSLSSRPLLSATIAILSRFARACEAHSVTLARGGSASWVAQVEETQELEGQWPSERDVTM